MKKTSKKPTRTPKSPLRVAALPAKDLRAIEGGAIEAGHKREGEAKGG